MLRIGMVGTNFISDWMAEAIEACEGIEAEAIYSRKQETGEAFAAKHQIPKVYTDFDKMLHSDKIDAVYIASPNLCHCSQAIKAMNAGKHVLCEKIIATNSKEFQRMKEAAMQNKVVLLEAMRPVHDPVCGILKEQMRKIGTVRRATIEYCQYSSRYNKFKTGKIDNAFNPALSNAAIMDIGVYCVHLCVKLFGKPDRIHAESTFLHNNMEGSGILLLQYGQMQVELVYSKITESAFPSIIQGEDGTLTVEKHLNAPNRITKVMRDGSVEEVNYAPEKNNMVYELRDFEKLVETNCWNHDYLKDSELAMQIIDEARRQTGIVFPADLAES